MKEDSLFGVINSKITRRSFLKWSAAIGATATAAGLVMSSAAKRAIADAPPGSLISPETGALANGGKVIEWIPTHCLMCHSWCELAVGLDADGFICKIEGSGGQHTTAPSRVKSGGVALTSAELTDNSYFYNSSSLLDLTGGGNRWGNPDDAARFPSVAGGFLPYGMNNKGRICAKGNNGAQHVYDPDRIKYPLKRRAGTDRGQGKWTKISWRQAYYEIANVIRELQGRSTACFGSTSLATANGYANRLRDLRHRHVVYIGRNEMDDGFSAFDFGSPNHIEHTSLCESSRHQSTLTLMGHHFPFPDLMTHSGTRMTSSAPAMSVDFMLEIGGNPCEAKIPHASYAARWGDMRRRGTVIAVVDVRQSNSAAFADQWYEITPGTDGALAMGILACMFATDGVGTATLQTELTQGHLGGLSKNATTMSTRRWTGIFNSEVSQNFLPSEAWQNVAPATQTYTAGGGATHPAVLTGQTLEAELQTAMTTSSWTVATAASTFSSICGVSAANIKYLAGAMAGATLDSTGLVTNWSGGTPTFNSPNVDGYRGPAKHTNGTYSWKAIRALQVLAGRFQVDATGIYNGTGSTWGRGGWQRPGGLLGSCWGNNTKGKSNAFSIGEGHVGSRTSITSDSSTGAAVTSSQTNMPKHTYPYASNKWNATHDVVTIDRWDYQKGRTKFGIGTQGNDPNVIPAIRASLGLHPYKVGAEVSIRRTSSGAGDVILPYGFRQTAYVASITNPGSFIYVGPHAGLANLSGGAATLYGANGSTQSLGTITTYNASTGKLGFNGGVISAPEIGDHVVVDVTDANRVDADFRVESLMIHKNAPGNTRANVKLFQELVTKKDVLGDYVLRHFWSCDTFMGDGTRFADIILPDTTYLERWDWKNDWEIMGAKGEVRFRQPVMRTDMSKPNYDPKSVELHLYESRPVKTIVRELATAVAGATSYDGYVGHSECWITGDEDYDTTITGGNVLSRYYSMDNGKPWQDVRLGGIGVMRQNFYIAVGSGADWGKIGAAAYVNGAAASTAQRTFAWSMIHGNVYDSTQVINEYTGPHSNFFGDGGWAKQNAPRTWLNDDLALGTAVGDQALWADGGSSGNSGVRGTNGFRALEVFNKRMTQILEPGFDIYLGGLLPAGMGAVGYKFRGMAHYQPTVEQTDGTYNLHLTTYKLNVHTQSRTAANPRQMEIIGNNWAVMNPATANTAFGAGQYPARVKVETAQGWVKLDLKVTNKVAAGVVAISASMGHEAKGQSGDRIGAVQSATGLSTQVYGNTDAFGRYRVVVNGADYDNRASGAASINDDAYNQKQLVAKKGDYTLGSPSAPGAGVQPNHAIQRTVRNMNTSASLACDPVGTSMAWFDSKCKVTAL